MIKLEGITKNFGSLQVLKGIDLEINKSEVVSIVGPSGAGKTTLLQIMGTLDEPDTGLVQIDGTVVSRMKEKELSAFRNKNWFCFPVPPTSSGVYGIRECDDSCIHCRGILKGGKRSCHEDSGFYGAGRPCLP